MRRTFQSLTVRNYRLFATGQLVKLIGMWMIYISQDWLVLELSGDSPTAVGITIALQFSPILVFTLIGGALADRYDKRKLLIVSHAAFAGMALLLAGLVLTGVVQLWQVFVLAAAIGTANAIEHPTRQSFVSELVGNKLLPNALALNSAMFNTARIVGPAVAGGAIALVGLGTAFMVAAVAASVPLLTLTRLVPAELYREPLPAAGGRRPARVRDGLWYVWRRSDLMLPVILVAVVGAFAFNFNVTLPVLSKVVHGTGAAAFGLLAAALAAGSLAGALAASWRRARPSAYLVLGAVLGFAVFAMLVGFSTPYWLVLTLLVPTGFFAIYFAQAANQRVQLGCDPSFRGRVMALYILVFMGTTPVGALVVGWWAEQVSVESAIWLGGLAALLAGAAGLLWQLRHHGERLRLQIRPRPRLSVIRAAGAGAGPAPASDPAPAADLAPAPAVGAAPERDAAPVLASGTVADPDRDSPAGPDPAGPTLAGIRARPDA